MPMPGTRAAGSLTCMRFGMEIRDGAEANTNRVNRRPIPAAVPTRQCRAHLL
jgi:hypothetical protein